MKKMKPSDYPQFYCRIVKDDKEEIEKLLEEILNYRISVISEDSRLPKRNELIVEALKGGLRNIKNKEVK